MGNPDGDSSHLERVLEMDWMVGQGRSCEQLAVDSFPHRSADSSRYKYEPQWVLRYVPLWFQVASGLPSFLREPAAERALHGFPCLLLPFEGPFSRVPGVTLSLVKCQSQPNHTVQPPMLGSEEVAHVGPGPAMWVLRALRAGCRPGSFPVVWSPCRKEWSQEWV